MTGGWVHAAGRMITCSPPRFPLQPSRVIDASSHLLFRAAGVLGTCWRYSAWRFSAPARQVGDPQASLGSCWRVRAAWPVAPRSTDTWAAQATKGRRPAGCAAVGYGEGSHG